MKDTTREIFMTVGTATLCTLLFKRGLRNVFIQGVSRLNKQGVRMVGRAYTLRYIPAREDLDTLDVFRDPAHPQRAAVEQIPEGCVLVMDCRGDASAASAGSILATRLQVRKCAGVVTDGGLRDAESISELDMPVYCAAPSAPTNLTKHHGVDLNVPIGCGTVPVFPDDVMVGDGDGVVVIPAEIADEIAEEAKSMDEFETWVTQQVAEGRSIVGLYPPNEETQAEYERSKQS
jgi:regulator of RNase E activity RraA